MKNAKCLKKTMGIVLATTVAASMSITAFAAPSTTVTYDLTGKASVTTTGAATADSQVTYVIYGGESVTEASVMYIDQDTATNGAYSFNFNVAADKIKDVTDINVIVGTDGATGAGTEDDIATAQKVTVGTVGDLSVTAGTTAVVAAGVYYTNDNVTFNVAGVTEFEYTLDNENWTKVEGTSVEVAGGSTVSFRAVEKEFVYDEEEIAATATPETPSVAVEEDATSDSYIDDGFTAGGSYTEAVVGNVGHFDKADINEAMKSNKAKKVGVVSSVNKTYLDSAKSANKDVEYGILFTVDDIENAAFNLNNDSEDVTIWKCQALGMNSNGEFAIKVIDPDGAIDTTMAKTRTYVKIGNIITYGNVQ